MLAEWDELSNWCGKKASLKPAHGRSALALWHLCIPASRGWHVFCYFMVSESTRKLPAEDPKSSSCVCSYRRHDLTVIFLFKRCSNTMRFLQHCGWMQMSSISSISGPDLCCLSDDDKSSGSVFVARFSWEMSREINSKCPRCGSLWCNLEQRLSSEEETFSRLWKKRLILA